MVDSAPRAKVADYLSLHLWLALLQLLGALYGVLVISQDFIPCNSVIGESGMTALLYVVVISQLVDHFAGEDADVPTRAADAREGRGAEWPP